MLSDEFVLTVGGPGCRPATPGEGTLDMKRSRPPRPAVWDLPDRLGMSWNGPAHGSYGKAADRHLPRPGDGRIRGITLSLRRPNPGRSHGHRRDTPRASQPRLGPGEY